MFLFHSILSCEKIKRFISYKLKRELYFCLIKHWIEKATAGIMFLLE